MLEKFREKYRKNQHTGSFEKSPGGARGEPGGPRRPPGAAPPLVAPGGRLVPLAHLWLSLSPIYPSSRENSRMRTLFRELASVPPPRFQDRERQQTSSRHPAGGGIDLRELPLHHGSMIGSYVMFSSPVCSSWFRPRELPYMIKAHM